VKAARLKRFGGALPEDVARLARLESSREIVADLPRTGNEGLVHGHDGRQ